MTLTRRSLLQLSPALLLREDPRARLARTMVSPLRTGKDYTEDPDRRALFEQHQRGRLSTQDTIRLLNAGD